MIRQLALKKEVDKIRAELVHESRAKEKQLVHENRAEKVAAATTELRAVIMRARR